METEVHEAFGEIEMYLNEGLRAAADGDMPKSMRAMAVISAVARARAKNLFTQMRATRSAGAIDSVAGGEGEGGASSLDF